MGNSWYLCLPSSKVIMKLTTSYLILLAAATASASGFKAPLQGIADAAQSPFVGNREKPLTVSARDNVRISHRAETAEAYLNLMLETGKDYSAAFGVSEFTPTELEEEYSFDHVRRSDGHRGRYRFLDMDEDSLDLSVPDIE